MWAKVLDLNYDLDKLFFDMSSHAFKSDFWGHKSHFSNGPYDSENFLNKSNDFSSNSSSLNAESFFNNRNRRDPNHTFTRQVIRYFTLMKDKLRGNNGKLCKNERFQYFRCDNQQLNFGREDRYTENYGQNVNSQQVNLPNQKVECQSYMSSAQAIKKLHLQCMEKNECKDVRSYSETRVGHVNYNGGYSNIHEVPTQVNAEGLANTQKVPLFTHNIFGHGEISAIQISSRNYKKSNQPPNRLKIESYLSDNRQMSLHEQCLPTTNYGAKNDRQTSKNTILSENKIHSSISADSDSFILAPVCKDKVNHCQLSNIPIPVHFVKNKTHGKFNYNNDIINFPSVFGNNSPDIHGLAYRPEYIPIPVQIINDRANRDKFFHSPFSPARVTKKSRLNNYSLKRSQPTSRPHNFKKNCCQVKSTIPIIVEPDSDVLSSNENINTLVSRNVPASSLEIKEIVNPSRNKHADNILPDTLSVPNLNSSTKKSRNGSLRDKFWGETSSFSEFNHEGKVKKIFGFYKSTKSSLTNRAAFEKTRESSLVNKTSEIQPKLLIRYPNLKACVIDENIYEKVDKFQDHMYTLPLKISHSEASHNNSQKNYSNARSSVIGGSFTDEDSSDFSSITSVLSVSDCNQPSPSNQPTLKRKDSPDNISCNSTTVKITNEHNKNFSPSKYQNIDQQSYITQSVIKNLNMDVIKSDWKPKPVINSNIKSWLDNNQRAPFSKEEYKCHMSNCKLFTSTDVKKISCNLKYLEAGDLLIPPRLMPSIQKKPVTKKPLFSNVTVTIKKSNNSFSHFFIPVICR